MHGHFVHVIGQVRHGIHDGRLGLPHLLDALWRIDLRQAAPIEVRQLTALRRIGNHDEVIPGRVSSGGRLNGELQALLYDAALYRTREIQALPDRARGVFRPRWSRSIMIAPPREVGTSASLADRSERSHAR